MCRYAGRARTCRGVRDRLRIENGATHLRRVSGERSVLQFDPELFHLAENVRALQPPSKRTIQRNVGFRPIVLQKSATDSLDAPNIRTVGNCSHCGRGRPRTLKWSALEVRTWVQISDTSVSGPSFFVTWMLLLTRPYCVVERFRLAPRRILSGVNGRRGVCDV
jgi:hypothetical protein